MQQKWRGKRKESSPPFSSFRLSVVQDDDANVLTVFDVKILTLSIPTVFCCIMIAIMGNSIPLIRKREKKMTKRAKTFTVFWKLNGFVWWTSGMTISPPCFLLSSKNEFEYLAEHLVFQNSKAFSYVKTSMSWRSRPVYIKLLNILWSFLIWTEGLSIQYFFSLRGFCLN